MIARQIKARRFTPVGFCFATESFAVYQAATGNGTIKELFADKHPEEQKIEPERPGIHRTDTVQNAQQVMEEHTTKIDNHKRLFG